MKAIKKWLMDKEGVFIVITWWIILFVIFTILLGVNINSVSKNLEITKETSKEYIQEFIKSGDLVLPYNESVSSASARYDQENEYYYLQINKYNLYSTKAYESTIQMTGDATASASIKLDLEVIDEFSIYYNNTLKTADLTHILTKTESTSGYRATIKATPSGELHILWNEEDTGIVYTAGSSVELSRDEDYLVVNGEVTDITFFKEGNKSNISYNEVKHEAATKSLDFDLVVEYKLGSKSYTTSNVNLDGLTDIEKGIVNESVTYFTELIEDSIGISKSAFTLLIVSAVVDTLLIAFGVCGIVLLKKSKDE